MGKTTEIVAKAMKDQVFRNRLVKDPKAAIREDFGIDFPEGVTLAVHENSATAVHLVLPAPFEHSTERRLTEEQLEMVAGGATSRPVMSGDTIGCTTGGYLCITLTKACGTK